MAVRYSRQVRLAEVGEAGQARLARSEVVVQGTGVAGEIEARYLAGAGVARLVVSEPGAAEAARRVDASVSVRAEAGLAATARAEAPLWVLDLDPAARDVALGAYRALEAIRAILSRKDDGRVS